MLSFEGKQTFYLIDEAQSPGKGANSMISMARHFFSGMDMERLTERFILTIVRVRIKTTWYYGMVCGELLQVTNKK